MQSRQLRRALSNVIAANAGKQKTRHGAVCGFQVESVLLQQDSGVLLVGATGVEPVTYAV